MMLHDDNDWRRLAFALRRVTEAGAQAAVDWAGRGRSTDADQATAQAMRAALATLGTPGVVVSGEGEKDEVPHLAHGERFGDEDAEPELDLAVDPIDGTTRMSEGLNGAISVLAAAPRGAFFDPGPAFYMEKFVVGPGAASHIDPTASVPERLTSLAEALGKPIRDVSVFVLRKPRHEGLIAEIREVGARAAVHPAGDVVGALRAALTDSGIDALMGTGGTPEGLVAACAVQTLGGAFFGRLDPQRPDEAERVQDAGLASDEWMPVSEIVRSEHHVFCATGVTPGPLLEKVSQNGSHISTQTLLVVGQRRGTGLRHLVSSVHPEDDFTDAPAD